MYVHTNASRLRALKPNQFGLSPVVAERLRGFGIDPEAHAARVKESYAARTRRAPPPTLALARARGNALELTLDPGDVTVTEVMNEAAMLWSNGEFVADEVSPPQPVDDRAGRYHLWARDEMRLPIDDAVGPNGTAKEVQPTLSNDTYLVTDRSLAGFMGRLTQNANPSLGARARMVANVMERMMLNREVRVATQLLTSTSFTASTNSISLGATRKWNGGSAATPILDMHTALEAIPAEVTHAVLSDVTWHAAQQNSEIKAIVASQLNNNGLLSPMDFGLYFGIPNVLIQKSYKQNAAGTVSRIWGSSALVLLHVNPARDALTFARTFRWKQGAGGFTTFSWFKPETGPHGTDYTKVSYADSEKVVAADFGYLMDGVRQ